MGNPTPPLAAEKQALEAAYAALNGGDIPAFMRVFDPQIERIEPDGFPGEGTYRGLEAVTAHFAQARGNWAEGACELQRCVAAGDKVVVFVHVHVRLKHETAWREGDVADVFTFRDGKAVQFRTFTDSRQALEWAGVNDARENSPN